MYRKGIVLFVALSVAACAASHASAQGVEGTWRLAYIANGAENATAIVKLQMKDGKTTGDMIAATPRIKGLTFKSVTQEGDKLRVTVFVGTTDLVFETTVPKQPTKRLTGTTDINGTLYPSTMTETSDETLTFKDSLRQFDCPPYQQARTLANRPLTLRFQAQQTKDAEKKKDLLKQAAEAEATAKKETPKLYREVLEKHADNAAVLDAALTLIRAAKNSDAKPDDVKGWASASITAAKVYGPRYEAEFAAQLVTALLATDGVEKLALQYARQAEKSLSPKASAADQVRVLGLLVRALNKTGDTKEAASYDTRVEKLDLILDTEYLAKGPGFKGTVFTGRKNQSDRAVFLELFTGATCPPCVAADLAFDVLQKTYKTSELVLLQYHVHIPGPDPLTNPDNEARWAFYRKAYPKEVTGAPSSIFNGKPQARGGGGYANAEAKYDEYRGVIDPLLEEKAGATLTAEARRDGDRIEINVKVSNVNDSDANKKLRIVLAEETIRYAGSNKVRLHHNVVRAFPGGVQGVALKEAATRHSASINLGNLRTDLTKYLNEYEENVRPFANPARPLAFNNLRVIAFVQDDSTREILQAVQVDVSGK